MARRTRREENAVLLIGLGVLGGLIAKYLGNAAGLAFLGVCAGLALLGALGGWLERREKARRVRAAGLFEIDVMTGVDFERRLASLFGDLGYRVVPTGRSGDFGGDLLVTDDAGRTAVVQSKRYRKSVGVSAIQEAHAARSYYGADLAIVVTNSTFTRQARELAERTGVELWDRDVIMERIEQGRPPATQ
jgi:HJR/Mrr/RecB family endonuclease